MRTYIDGITVPQVGDLVDGPTTGGNVTSAQVTNVHNNPSGGGQRNLVVAGPGTSISKAVSEEMTKIG